MTPPSAPEPGPRPLINSTLADLSPQSPTELAAAMNRPGMRGALAEKMGIELLTASADEVSARMPVEGNTQPYGILHGGATVVLAETVGSFAAAIHAGSDFIAMGVEVGATHHRAVREGYVTATARPLHLGRQMASYVIDVVDDAGKRTATCRLTCLLRPVS